MQGVGFGVSPRLHLRLERRLQDGTPAEGYQLADFGFPLKSEAPAENGQADPHDGSTSAHAAADEQGDHEAEPEEEPEQEPAEETMNRGLLLKFLSSVRN